MNKASRTVNEVIMIWWVANDPVAKESKNSQALVVFNLATKRDWITKDSHKKEELQYHKMAAWWRIAEKALNMVIKWTKVYVRWYLHNRKIQIPWESSPRTITEVIANDILVLANANQSDMPSQVAVDMQEYVE